MASWENVPLKRGRTAKCKESLKDGGHGGRGSTGLGGGATDGVRTEACGWFDLSHVCVQPRLFAASWMSMKRWFPLPPGPFCLGPGRCVLSRPAEFLDEVSFFSPACYLQQKLPFWKFRVCSDSIALQHCRLTYGTMESLKALEKYGVYQPSHLLNSTSTKDLTQISLEESHHLQNKYCQH